MKVKTNRTPDDTDAVASDAAWNAEAERAELRECIERFRAMRDDLDSDPYFEMRGWLNHFRECIAPAGDATVGEVLEQTEFPHGEVEQCTRVWGGPSYTLMQEFEQHVAAFWSEWFYALLAEEWPTLAKFQYDDDRVGDALRNADVWDDDFGRKFVGESAVKTLERAEAEALAEESD